MQICSLVGRSWCGNTVCHNQPTVFHCLVDIGIAGQSKGKAQSWRHHTSRTLSQHITDVGCKTRKGHGILVTIGDAYGANHHEQAGGTLRWLVPPLILQRWLGSHRQLDGGRIAVLYLYLILVYNLIFNRIHLPVTRSRRYYQTLRLLVVGNGKGAVRAQCQLLLIRIFVLGKRSISRISWLFRVSRLICLICLICLAYSASIFTDGFSESLIRFLEEGEVVIERLHIEIAIDVQLAIVRNGIAQFRSIV